MRREHGQKSARKYQRALSTGQKASLGGGNGGAGAPRKPGRAGKKDRKKESSEVRGPGASLLGQGGVPKRRGSRMRREPMDGLFGKFHIQ